MQTILMKLTVILLLFIAMMKVSKDFFMYESGVYKCSKLASGSKTGYHAVRIVGWGEEQLNGKTVKYWVGTWYIIDIHISNDCQIGTWL